MTYRTHVLLGLSFGLSLATAGQAQEVAFADIDANGDGVLSAAEFSATFPNAGAGDFAALDRDGDGFVTTSEVSGSEDVTFADADTNGDGVLTGDELDHFSPRAQQALMRFDRDGDGFVTLNEVRSSDDPVGERGNRVGQERTAQGQDRETRNQGNGNGGERRSQGNGNGQRN